MPNGISPDAIRSPTGTTESSIQPQGNERILVEAPGLGDPQRLKDLVGQTAELTFHMVQSQISTPQAGAAPAAPGSTRFVDATNPGLTYVVDDVPLMTGEDINAGFAGLRQQLVPLGNEIARAQLVEARVRDPKR